MIATHLIGAVLAALAALAVMQLRIDGIRDAHKAAVAELVQEHQAAALAQRTKAATQQAAITQQYEGALNAARIRETSLRIDIGRAYAAAERLRVQIRTAGARIDLPTTPPAAVSEYALAASELLDDCSRRYQELAAVADGHALDVRTLAESWPVISSNP